MEVWSRGEMDGLENELMDQCENEKADPHASDESALLNDGKK